MKFPSDYPYSPPSIRFMNKIWHPNVYEVSIFLCFVYAKKYRFHLCLSSQNGDLCISILHSPIDDPQSGELPCERWNPTQNVRLVVKLFYLKFTSVRQSWKRLPVVFLHNLRKILRECGNK